MMRRLITAIRLALIVAAAPSSGHDRMPAARRSPCLGQAGLAHPRALLRLPEAL
jgi:hypothetical protein